MYVAAVCGGSFGKLCSLFDHFNLLLAVLIGGAQVKGLADLCDVRGIPFIADEVGDAAGQRLSFSLVACFDPLSGQNNLIRFVCLHSLRHLDRMDAFKLNILNRTGDGCHAVWTGI